MADRHVEHLIKDLRNEEEKKKKVQVPLDISDFLDSLNAWKSGRGLDEVLQQAYMITARDVPRKFAPIIESPSERLLNMENVCLLFKFSHQAIITLKALGFRSVTLLSLLAVEESPLGQLFGQLDRLKIQHCVQQLQLSTMEPLYSFRRYLHHINDPKTVPSLPDSGRSHLNEALRSLAGLGIDYRRQRASSTSDSWLPLHQTPALLVRATFQFSQVANLAGKLSKKTNDWSRSVPRAAPSQEPQCDQTKKQLIHRQPHQVAPSSGTKGCSYPLLFLPHVPPPPMKGPSSGPRAVMRRYPAGKRPPHRSVVFCPVQFCPSLIMSNGVLKTKLPFGHFYNHLNLCHEYVTSLLVLDRLHVVSQAKLDVHLKVLDAHTFLSPNAGRNGSLIERGPAAFIHDGSQFFIMLRKSTTQVAEQQCFRYEFWLWVLASKEEVDRYNYHVHLAAPDDGQQENSSYHKHDPFTNSHKFYYLGRAQSLEYPGPFLLHNRKQLVYFHQDFIRKCVLLDNTLRATLRLIRS